MSSGARGGGGGARRVEVFDAPRGVYLDVCAGAGGLGLGLHRAGWRGTGLERDADAVRTHRARVGPCCKCDVTTAIAPHPADFVAGGVPCQPFSLAGDREALDDPRGRLFEALLRLAREAGARALLMENVAGLVRLGVLPVVLDAMGRDGWHCSHALVNTADYGVPQNRKRVLIVGFRDPADLARFVWPAPTHGAPGNLFGLPRWRTVRDALGLPLDEPSNAVTASEGRDGVRGAHGGTARGRGAGAALARHLDAPAPTVTGQSWHQGRSVRASQRAFGEVAAALAEAKDGTRTRRQLLGALESAGLVDRPATTIDHTARVSAAGHHASNKTGAVALLPKDCASLQGFPKGFRFSGSKTSQHRQIGNAVPPKLGEAVGVSVWRALYGASDGQ